MCGIRHCVPNIGPVTVDLYPPADEVYSLLSDAGEIERLTRLRHIGALEVVYPGISHTRWDYTVAVLYVVSRLQDLFTSAAFSLGNARFSSTAAALQCLALLSNIEHLPGTYAVEKGVTRFLLRQKEGNRLKALLAKTPWTHSNRDRAMEEADSELVARDYLVLNRLFGLVKLGTDFRGRKKLPDWLVHDLYAPFLLEDLRHPNPRWSDIEEWFDKARRLAYLNQDTTLVESPVTINVSRLLSNLFDRKHLTSEALSQSTEILGAYEHMVYERFYHRQDARRATAVVACRVVNLLEATPDPMDSIVKWMYDSRVPELEEGEDLQEEVEKPNLVASVSLRSVFPALSGNASETEDVLAQKMATGKGAPGQSVAAVLQYEPYEPEHAIQPDHVYIDTYVLGEPHPNHVGRVIRWVVDELDEDDADPDDDFYWLCRPALDLIYKQLLARLIEVARPELRVRIRPWALSRLGKFKDRDGRSDRFCFWPSARDLNNQIARHVLRKPADQDIPGGYRSLAEELRGLRQLRVKLRKEMVSKSPPRRRYFLITGSILLDRAQSATQREFDGGILQLSARNGAASLYLLETKSGQSAWAAENALSEKLKSLKLQGEVARLPSKAAYVRLPL